MKEIAKHGEIIKAEFDIFTSEKHKGVSRLDYKGTMKANANPVNDIQTKISKSLTERKTISF